MSNYWLPVLAAFGWGMALAYLLEAVSRFRAGSKRPWPFLCLALTCAALALFIRGYESGIRNDEGIAVTYHASQPALRLPKGITENRLPITDDQLPPTPTRLQIPRLHINRPIVTVPLVEGAWDVADLGGDVGLLATTGQHPGDDLAMVLAGHMTFADGRLLETGAFAELQYATYGTEIVVEMGAETAVYQVSEIRRLAPDDVDALYLADGESILLITCTDWNDSTGLYASRLLVRATRVP